MSTAVMTERMAEASPRHLARIAGGLYLIIIVAGFFAIGLVPALAPEFAAGLFPYIQVPSGVAELSLCLWFLVMGVNVQRWKEQASKASEPDHSVLGKAAV